MRTLALSLFCIAALAPTAVSPGALTSVGASTVLGNRITVCFVGDAVTAPAPALFVAQIQGFLRDHEAVANINYVFTGQCAGPTIDAAGLDVYGGDLRLVLSGTTVPYSPPPNAAGRRVIPGNGCDRGVPVAIDSMTRLAVLDASGNEIDTFASFGIFPSERTPQWDTHCQWNMRLGSDGQGGVPWRNHTLHEFGHSLGFAHEQTRPDARDAIRNAACSRNPDGTDSQWFADLPTQALGNTLLSTEPYDFASTMNYSVPDCGYVGNYSNAGLGELEKLSLHFMYPETERVAEYYGRTVLRTGETSTLVALWPLRGSSITNNPMITSYAWSVDGQLLASGPAATSAALQFPTAGDRRLTLSYTDFAGRGFSFQTTVHVLAPDQFARRMATLATLE